MKQISFFFCFVLFFSCKEPVSNPDNQTVSGKDIYNSKCVICHGSDGKLGISGAKDLSLSSLTDEEKHTIISTGKGAMAGYGTLLSKEEITAVVEFVNSLKTNG